MTLMLFGYVFSNPATRSAVDYNFYHQILFTYSSFIIADYLTCDSNNVKLSFNTESESNDLYRIMVNNNSNLS